MLEILQHGQVLQELTIGIGSVAAVMAKAAAAASITLSTASSARQRRRRGEGVVLSASAAAATATISSVVCVKLSPTTGGQSSASNNCQLCSNECKSLRRPRRRGPEAPRSADCPGSPVRRQGRPPALREAADRCWARVRSCCLSGKAIRETCLSTKCEFLLFMSEAKNLACLRGNADPSLRSG